MYLVFESCFSVVFSDFNKQSRPHKKRKSPTRNRIIPHDEDVRRLLQECKIGQGNANVLSQALFHVRPETFKKDSVIRVGFFRSISVLFILKYNDQEFYQKCRSSHELIYTQIPWATAEAEKSISTKDSQGVTGNDQEMTKEQQLLGAILAANGELFEVLQQYDDMNRVAMERKAEYRSLKETRLGGRVRSTLLFYRLSSLIHVQKNLEVLEQQNPDFSPFPLVSLLRSRSPSPSIRSSSPHHILDLRRPLPEASPNTPNTLAPPPIVPNGPRSPVQLSHLPRTPPLTTLTPTSLREIDDAYYVDVQSIYDSSYDDADVPIQPSAKALGKQRAIETESIDCMCHVNVAPFFLIHGIIAYSQYERDSTYLNAGLNRQNSLTFDDLESEIHYEPSWHKPIHYVYDAAAERTAARMREEHESQAILVNGVR